MNNQQPVVMIYKRTHKGDPDCRGVFGIHDCMGKVRNREYDAVIGIGGKRPWVRDKGIAQRINWVGVTPKKHGGTERAPLVSFSKFCLYEDKGPLVREIAPKLYKHMYQETASDGRRVVMSNSSLPPDIFGEVLEILKLADDCPSSIETSALLNKSSKQGCKKKRCSPSKVTLTATKAARKCR